MCPDLHLSPVTRSLNVIFKLRSSRSSLQSSISASPESSSKTGRRHIPPSWLWRPVTWAWHPCQDSQRLWISNTCWRNDGGNPFPGTPARRLSTRTDQTLLISSRRMQMNRASSGLVSAWRTIMRSFTSLSARYYRYVYKSVLKHRRGFNYRCAPTMVRFPPSGKWLDVIWWVIRKLGSLGRIWRTGLHPRFINVARRSSLEVQETRLSKGF